MIAVLSASRHLHAPRERAALPALEPQLLPLCRESFRRIDRFVQLALLGSGLCARGHALLPDCGVYLGSAFGPLGSNISVQEQLVRDRQLPKPFNFVNTLGSSAGFYVARNLGLHGQNFFIARTPGSFEAALVAALADFAAGAIQQALVGAVDEITLPLDEHRRRSGLPPSAMVAETSHWLLLTAHANTARVTLDMQRYANFAGLQTSLRSAWRTGDLVRCAPGMSAEYAARLLEDFPRAESTEPDTAYHHNPEAAWLTDFVVRRPKANLFLASGGEPRGWRLFHCRT
jgi:hypothetical protein